MGRLLLRLDHRSSVPRHDVLEPLSQCLLDRRHDPDARQRHAAVLQEGLLDGHEHEVVLVFAGLEVEAAPSLFALEAVGGSEDVAKTAARLQVPEAAHRQSRESRVLDAASILVFLVVDELRHEGRDGLRLERLSLEELRRVSRVTRPSG